MQLLNLFDGSLKKKKNSITRKKQMNYDGLLSQLTEDKLVLFETTHSGQHVVDGNVPPTSTSSNATTVHIEDGAIEEEQAAPIQTVVRSSTLSHNSNSAISKSEASTPQRKISASSRFMNAFTQLYGGNSVANNDGMEEITETAAATNRTPTKGMESKLLSMWHNVKYGWGGKMRTSFSKEQPVWLLGRCYHRRYTPPVSMESSTELPSGADTSPDNATSAYDSIQPIVSSLYPTLSVDPQQVDEIVVPQELGMDAVENQVAENAWEEGIEGFRRDFYSRIWMTYRREFPIMNGSNYTSDCGWGCMLRSGQMLMSQALICHFLGRSWRYDPESQLHSTFEDNMHKKIIKWFGDSSSKSSPFSIHTLVRLGEQRGKKPGDWYGPASVSHLLKHALENAAQENADFDNIVIYVARDCTIYMQDVEELCHIPEPTPKPHVPWQSKNQRDCSPRNEQHPQQHWKALIVLIPLRLGTEKVNPVYAHCLKLLLSTEHCVGIIGGRPKHSLYFVGFQEDRLIHLDPHYCQEMVDVNQENFSLHSFHCKSPRKIKLGKMDPSCCIGFYCSTKTDFYNFVESVQLYLHPMRCASGASVDKMASALNGIQPAHQGVDCMEMNYPLFTFSRGRCLENTRDEMSDSLYKPLQRQVAQLTQELLGTTTAMSTSVASSNSYDYDVEDSESEEFVLL